MFAIQNDQENFVHGQQQVAASKPLNQGTRGAPPKTPGNKYPKTPLRIPLNDENAPTGYGKGGMGTQKKGNENLMTGGKKAMTFGNNAFVTPMRNRAPLGMKTTNAKTNAFKTPGPAGDKQPEKNQPTTSSTIRRPKKVSHAETVKLEIHGDDTDPLDVPDVEYAPPNPPELPYESDVFPDGCLNYDVFKGKNLMRGWQAHFSNPVDENGVSKKQKEHEEAMAKALKEGEAKILKAIEELDWSVPDVPETWPENKQPKKAQAVEKKAFSTINARKAASALSGSVPSRPNTAMSSTLNARKAAAALSGPVPSRPTTSMSRTSSSKGIVSAPKPKFPTSFTRSKKPAPPISAGMSNMDRAAAVATSKTSIGYSKGRATSAAIRANPYNSTTHNTNPIIRSPSTVSLTSSQNATMTPALFAKQQNEEVESPHLAFLKAFDKDDDDSDERLAGSGLPKYLIGEEEEEEEFVMTLNLK